MAGIPVRLHFSLVLLLPWLIHRYAVQLDLHVGGGALYALGLFASVALHELGHALTARRFGVRTSEIVLTPIGGIARLDRIPAQPRAELWIAIAGPLVSLGLAAACFGLHLAAGAAGWPFAKWIAFYWTVTNGVLAVFNLLPCFPMDGGRVLRALMTPRWGRLEATRRAVVLGGWLAFGLAAWGLSQFSLLTVAIAWFVHSSAKAEYRNVQWQEGARPPSPFEVLWRFSSAPPPPPPPPPTTTEITVGPPPYRR